MTTKIQKWGNSQGLRLAKHILEDSGISIGDEVEIVISENEIRIIKKTRPKFILEEMVARMPKNYIVIEESFGNPTGNEAW